MGFESQVVSSVTGFFETKSDKNQVQFPAFDSTLKDELGHSVADLHNQGTTFISFHSIFAGSTLFHDNILRRNLDFPPFLRIIPMPACMALSHQTRSCCRLQFPHGSSVNQCRQISAILKCPTQQFHDFPTFNQSRRRGLNTQQTLVRFGL